MGWGNEYVGALLLVLGVALALIRRKLQFDRTNQFGVEMFPSYWSQLGANMGDGLLRYTSVLLLLAGVLIFGFRFEDSWGWVVTLPFCALMIFLFFGS